MNVCNVNQFRAIVDILRAQRKQCEREHIKRILSKCVNYAYNCTFPFDFKKELFFKLNSVAHFLCSLNCVCILLFAYRFAMSMHFGPGRNLF